MKNTFCKPKGKRVDVEATLPHTAQGIADGTTTAGWQGPVSCVNLRPGPEPGRLVPVDDFEAVANTGAEAEPMLCWNHPERGECLLLRSGNALTVLSGCEHGAEATARYTTSPLMSVPLCAAAEGDGGRVTVMTAERAFYLSPGDADGVWRVEEARPELPAVTLMAGDFSTLTAEVAPTRLKGSYTASSHRLSGADSKTLRDDLNAAVEEAECLARSAGRSIAPLLMRYRLKNACGDTLFLSPVVLVGTDNGYQLSGEMSATVSTGDVMARSAVTLSVESFRPQLRLPGGTDSHVAGLVKQLEVEAVGPLHGTDADGIVWNNIDVTERKLRFYMPGMAATMASDTEGLRRMIVEALARFDELSERVASVDDPFGTDKSGKVIDTAVPSGGLSAAKCRKKLMSAIARPLKDRALHERRLCGNGWTAAAFTADTAATNGDTTIWGNITALPHQSWGAGHFATDSNASQAWTSTTSTERNEGRATCNMAGYDHAPRQLSPLIVWPGESGGRMTIKVKTAEGTAIETVELTPVAGSGLSARLSPNLRPTALSYSSDNTFRVAAPTVAGKKLTGAIATTPSGNSLSPAGLMLSPGSRIAGITTATALSSAWDFSRDRFYVFGDGGIHLCITNSRHEPLAVQVIDGRPVRSRHHIATGTADRGVAVIAGGCAVNVRGSKATDFPGITPDNASGIGWERGDLWIMLESGKAQVRPSEAPDHFYLRDTPAIVSSLSSGDGRLRIVDRDGLLHDSLHRTQSDKEVEWSCRIEMPQHVATPTRGTIGSVLRITAIGLAMVASAVKARLTATTDGGAAGIAMVRLLLSAMISGTMKESLFLPVGAGRRHWFTIGVKGTVSPDMRLSGVSLHMK